MFSRVRSSMAELLVLTQEAVGSSPTGPTNLRLASSKVERHTEDVGVGGSIPSLGTTTARLAKWSKAAVCKAAGSNPPAGPNPALRSTIRKGLYHG